MDSGASRTNGQLAIKAEDPANKKGEAEVLRGWAGVVMWVGRGSDASESFAVDVHCILLPWPGGFYVAILSIYYLGGKNLSTCNKSIFIGVKMNLNKLEIFDL